MTATSSTSPGLSAAAGAGVRATAGLPAQIFPDFHRGALPRRQRLLHDHLRCTNGDEQFIALAKDPDRFQAFCESPFLRSGPGPRPRARSRFGGVHGFGMMDAFWRRWSSAAAAGARLLSRSRHPPCGAIPSSGEAVPGRPWRRTCSATPRRHRGSARARASATSGPSSASSAPTGGRCSRTTARCGGSSRSPPASGARRSGIVSPPRSSRASTRRWSSISRSFAPSGRGTTHHRHGRLDAPAGDLAQAPRLAALGPAVPFGFSPSSGAARAAERSSRSKPAQEEIHDDKEQRNLERVKALGEDLERGRDAHGGRALRRGLRVRNMITGFVVAAASPSARSSAPSRKHSRNRRMRVIPNRGEWRRRRARGPRVSSPASRRRARVPDLRRDARSRAIHSYAPIPTGTTAT